VFSSRGPKARKEQDNRGEQRFNAGILHEAVSLHVRVRLHRVTHRFRKDQVHHQVRLHQEATVVNVAAVLADHGVKMIKE